MGESEGDARVTPFAWFRWFRRLVLLVVLVVVVGYGATCVAVWKVARADDTPRADAIVVLGASQFDGRPSEVFTARLRHAKALHDERVAARIVTTGGKLPGDRFTEAEAGARWLRDHGVPAADVLAVPRGNDTLASLRAADQALAARRARRVVLVSDPWHMLRCGRIARDLGLDAATSPARTGPAVHTRGTQVRYILREAAAYLYYRVFHSDATRGPGAV
jgi:uncharacterized SAM-binding protein YcdF (DUF218 family)